MASEEQPSSGRFKKVMGGLDMTLFTVCAVLVIDQLAASAAIGTSSIFWWIFTLIFFFIPYGLMTAELGTTYPEQGGIYGWVRRAFGARWGARISWLYWVNVALWMPAVYVLFAGMFAQLFFPELSLWAKIAIGVVMTWLTVGINVVSLDIGKWIPNIGAVVKVTIMAVIGIGGFVFAAKHGVANDFSLPNLLPTWGAGLAFLPVIVYNFLGFELMSGAAEEMENPGRDIPRAIMISGTLIAAFYILGTLGILLALPLEEIGLIEGIIDTLEKFLGTSGVGHALVVAIGIGALFSFFANMVTWTMGANRSAAEAAEAGELPAVLGKVDSVRRTPVGAAIWTGVVSTGVIVLYGFFASSAEDLFWSLFAFSSIVFLLPYLAMFPAFVVLRRRDSEIDRPYTFPGGFGVGCAFAAICCVFIVQAIVFFVWVPGEPIDWSYSGSVVTGVLVTIALGEWLVRRQSTRGRGASTLSRPEPHIEPTA